MSKIRVCASVLAVVFLLWLQPFSYSQINFGQIGQALLSGDPVSDSSGDLLFFKTMYSKSDGAQTEVILISPSSGKATDQTYGGVLSPIKVGKQAIYALQSVPPSSGSKSAATVSLVALVTPPLPSSLPSYSLTGGNFDFLKVARTESGVDYIYVLQMSSEGSSVLIFTFNGSTTFTLAYTVPLP